MMLCLRLLCLFISSCYSNFDVSVTVVDPFYLNYYYDYNGYYYARQLQVEFHVVYGDKRSNSYYFQTDFDTSYPPSRIKFVNNDNIISLFFNPLLLGSPILLPEVSPDDNLDIRFDIDPVYIREEYLYEKCGSDERLHNHTIIPRSILHSEANHGVMLPFTIDLSHTPCLTSTESWFHDQTAHINVQVHFDCHGPCKDLFTTTTSIILTTPTTTAIPTTTTRTSTVVPTSATTTTSTMPATTSTTTTASTSSTDQTTTEVTMEPTMTTQSTSTQNQAQHPAGGSNKLVIPLTLVAVIAVLELIVVIWCAVNILKRIRPNYFKRKVEPSSVYYDAAVQKVHNEIPSAPPQSNEYYMEANDTNEEYVQVKPARNQENSNENNFADNAIYGQ